MDKAFDLMENREVDINYVMKNSTTGKKSKDFRFTHKFKCPNCKQPVIVKSGETNYFAHKSNSNVCDSWYSNDKRTGLFELAMNEGNETFIDRRKSIMVNGITHVANLHNTKTKTIMLYISKFGSLNFDELRKRIEFFAKNRRVMVVFNLAHKDLERIKSYKNKYCAYEENIGRKILKLFDYVISSDFLNSYNEVRIFLDLKENPNIAEINDRGRKQNVIFLDGMDYEDFKCELETW